MLAEQIVIWPKKNLIRLAFYSKSGYEEALLYFHSSALLILP